MATPEFSIEISANAVAWYGAVVATISASVGFYNVWKDRSRVKIKYRTGMYLVGDDSLYKNREKHISISVVNTGTRPINISQAYVQLLNSKDKFILTDSFAQHRPKVLDERLPETNFFASENDLDVSKIYKVIVVDGFGNEHTKYIKYFPTLPKLYYRLKNRLNARDATETES